MLVIGSRASHDRVSVVRQFLNRDAGEESGEAGVVVLAPTLARMVMTLSTLDPHAEKQLADRSAGDFRRVERLEKRRRTFALRRPLNRENLPNHFVVRSIRSELLSQPASQPDGSLRRNF